MPSLRKATIGTSIPAQSVPAFKNVERTLSGGLGDGALGAAITTGSGCVELIGEGEKTTHHLYHVGKLPCMRPSKDHETADPANPNEGELSDNEH